MAEQGFNLQDFQWREVFVFTRIFKAFRVAIRPSKMLLALAAIVLMYCGGRVMDAAWPQAKVDAGYARREGIDPNFVPGGAKPPFDTFLNEEVSNFATMTKYVVDMNWGYPSGVPKAVAAFAIESPIRFWKANKAYFSILFAWFLVTWAVFGGAICRIAAVHVARDEVISPVRALRFSIKAFPSFLAAPLIPLIAVMLLGVLTAGIGAMLLYIPYAGPIVAGLLMIIPLLLSLAMAFLVIGAVAGSSLMYPTIAVEGSDAFDAISRALSHVFAAPWRLLFYTAVAIVYGTLTYFFVRLCAYIVLTLTHFFMGWFVFGDAEAQWLAMWPTPDFDHLAYDANWNALNWGGKAGAGLMAFWNYLVIAGVGAFVMSFYFSASTIIYLLMRRKVDATELDAVYLEPADEAIPETRPAPAGQGGEPPTGQTQTTPPPSNPLVTGSETPPEGPTPGA